MYNDVLAQKWIDEICSRITKDLVDMNKPFKYLGKFESILQFIYGMQQLIPTFLCFLFSIMHNYAEEWSWSTHEAFLFLGPDERQHSHCPVAQ